MQFMTTPAAILTCLVLGALTIFQGLLALGAPLGRFAWGGQHRVLPLSLRVGSLVSIVIYALIAAVVLTRADVVSPSHISEGVVRLATWVVVAYFFLGIGMNLASRSRPERVLMSPIAALLCALCAVVAVS
jgi:hypothetical protein